MGVRPVVHGFVTPALDGPPTGGTLFNAQLLAALARAGVSCRHFELATLPADPAAVADVLWVDSLYLEAMPELRARARGLRLHLLLHYLPSFVEHGRALAHSELSAVELRALALADAVLVTSRTMQAALGARGASKRPVLCIEPGAECAPAVTARERHAGGAVAGWMLCSVVTGKGVLPLLQALANAATPEHAFTLAIAGRTDLDPAYAQRCIALIAAEPALRGRVRVLGALPHARALEALRAADVLISSSRMEAYGMALAEARACGVPVIARQGGHAAAHVDPAAGGELVADESAVAGRFLDLVRDREELAERKRKAVAGARGRSWDQVAAEWIAAVERLLPR
jgi:hypothetical protein